MASDLPKSPGNSSYKALPQLPTENGFDQLAEMLIAPAKPKR